MPRKYANLNLDYEVESGPMSKTTNTKKKFVAWDGEGSMDNRDAPQDYVLFGNSELEYIEGPRLTTSQCIEFALDQGAKYPATDYIHVGFAFDYDSNQILSSLSPKHFEELADNGVCYYSHYRIEHLAHKWIILSDRREKNRRIKIMDVWGFFQGSFVKAIESYIPNHPLMSDLEKIKAGKAERMNFSYDNIDYIRSYWTTEIQLLAALVEQLREYMLDVDLDIKDQYYGPGAIANSVFKKHGIDSHMAITPDPVRRAAAFAYAGGRFELFRMGRHSGTVYGMDINSAYPAGMAKVPSLTEGTWRHEYFPDTRKPLSEFAVHRIKLRAPMANSSRPSPVFHRDSRGNITYPWHVEGWYWTPEVECLQRMGLPSHMFSIEESWSYEDWTTRPFAFINDLFEQRKVMKAKGQGSEKAIKLAINSLYGKTAQRAGWERKNRAPTWHQLEWAGYITSHARAQLYSVMERIPWSEIVAVETDGIYTTANPTDVGISDSKELGGWEVTEYDGIMYLQSGVYFYGTAKGPVGKYRGLDAGSLDSGSMEAYLQTLIPGNHWASLSGPTTRFIGYRAAHHRYKTDGDELKRYHRRWITTQRDISPGSIGKRRHVPGACRACKIGASAYDAPHDLLVVSAAYHGEPESVPHFIPWEPWGGKEPEWREMEIAMNDLLV